MYSILYSMNAITYTEARANLANTITRVCDDHDPVIITKKSDKAVVMISLDDFEAMEETAYLLRSPSEKGKTWDDLQKVMAKLGLKGAT